MEELYPRGPQLAERGRELTAEPTAERGGWPPEALPAVRDLEARNPRWFAWWTERPWRRDGQVPDGPCFGAALIDNTRAGENLYAAAANELEKLIRATEEEDRRARP